MSMKERAIKVVCGYAWLSPDGDEGCTVNFDDWGFSYEGGIKCKATGKPCEQVCDNYLAHEHVLKCPNTRIEV